MKRGSTLFLKSVIGLMALGMFAALAWFPRTEGRAVNLSLIQIYSDPFILYIYVASIPFFVALFQGIKLLGLIEKNKVFTPGAVRKVRNIKYCAMAIICFLLGAMGWVRFASGGDDPAGALVMGMGMTLVAMIVGTAAAVFQRLLQTAVELKSENDLTV